ncbi:ubiquitin-protein ligase [Colwellia sp. MT41]|uniref:acyloxyacyl hydrolase n=1 Tax=Colwellia sp. MT41 TaxID=58049 RepID=UPI0007177296|nr:acyloxyacyl hydrolase [Colwellia sp. MT41]ALO34956.1 ubiquitin-protein ligase [Colwellia sp. MT41]
MTILDLNKYLTKSNNINPIVLAVLLVISVILPSQSFAQDFAQDFTQDKKHQEAKPAIAKAQSQTDSDIEFTAEISVENLDEIYREMASNTLWENSTPAADFYDSPFQLSIFSDANGEDSDRLWSQTNSIFTYGFGVIGIIALLPEEISNWDKEEGIIGKWSDNVKAGPVWDRDTGMLNLIGHPYFGGVYYQVARKSGYRQWDAFLYSAIMSTFYWEYGIEAFAETPSIQDLVITPVLGWAYGEWAFNTEMDIREQGGTVLGSSMLGSTALFFLDPVDSMSVGINNIFGKEIIRAGTGFVSFNEIPYGYTGQTDRQINFNISLQFGDGGSYTPSTMKRSSYNNDPIDTGIIGVSYGVGNVVLDDLWDIAGGTTTEYSLGLYFTRQFSSRVTYSKAKLTNNLSAAEDNYENYSVDSQFYFNTDSDFRPYLTAGFGETLWRRDIDSKRFQVNAGAGLHYKLNNNFALQLDWRFYHSTNANTSDHNTSLRLVYLLGNGER